MRKNITLFVALALAAAALPCYSGPVVFSSSDDAGGAFRTMNGNDLLIEFYASGSLPGVTAIAFADIRPDPGDEIIVGRNGTLEIRSGSGYALLDSRGGFEMINSIAVGDLDTGHPGKEIVVSSTTGGVGRLSVVDPQTAGLPDLAFLTAGVGMSATGIGDVRTDTAGNELVFCWQYQASPDATQVAVTRYASGVIDPVITFVNVTGVVNVLVCAKTNPAVASDQIVTGCSDGVLHVFNGNTVPPMDQMWRGGFQNITAMAVGEVRSDNPGLEIVEGSNDSGGAVRVISGSDIFSDITSRAGFVSFQAVAIGDVNSTHAGNDVVAASSDSGNALRIMNPDDGLADLAGRSGFGAFTSAGVYDAPITGVNDWTLY
ncbi:MAG: hypothetical protein NTY46_07765 [Candidatus Sumerlaeota bacterium]|nr:hypothetical protein [Candidatus Sumerlaeota bacterium]